MYVYYLKNDLTVDDNHLLKKGKVMATSEENILNNDFYDVIQCDLTRDQLEKQAFLYVADRKPFIDESEVILYERTLTKQNL